MKSLFLSLIAALAAPTPTLAASVVISGFVSAIDAQRINVSPSAIQPLPGFDPSALPFEIGSPFQLVLNISLASAPSPFVDGTQYVVPFTMAVGGYAISDATGALTFVDNRDDGAGGVTDYTFFSVMGSGIATPPNGGVVGGLPFSNINLSFEEYSGTAFVDELLKDEKFVLGSFDAHFISLVFSFRQSADVIDAIIVRFATTASTVVPIPAALPMMAFGLALLSLLRRKVAVR